MNREELQEAIIETLEKIEYVKFELEKAIDTKDKKRLRQQLRELQYLQLWHIGQLESQKD